MSREIRKVPADWKHPVNMRGDFIHLLEGGAAQPQSYWDVGKVKWEEGFRDDFNGGWQPREGDELTSAYVDWCGMRPIPEDYMPQWTPEEATHFMMYESCSEGTPISPAFATPEEVARWCADNGASAFADMTAPYEAWLRIAQGGYAPSMVLENGKLQSGVEALG